MLRRIVLLLLPAIVLPLLFSCASMRPLVDVHREANPEVFMELHTAVDKGATNWWGVRVHYMIKVWMHEHTDEFDSLVQEVVIDDGTVLVETFKMDPRTVCLDGHSGFGKGVRKMIVYPATVEGADYQGGFAHLPQNMDGTRVTNVGPNFNTQYQKHHKTQGKIVKEDRSLAFTWSFETDEEGKIVWIKSNGKKIYPTEG